MKKIIATVLFVFASMYAISQDWIITHNTYYNDLRIRQAMIKNNPSILFDTIKCKVDSVSDNKVYYTNKNGKNKHLNIYDVISYSINSKKISIPYEIIYTKDSASYKITQHIH
jgi:hypothetical protein